ncbi:efflux RND transporter periplasmic adaptor subunit [Ignavibacterium sp.]|uniref:efflux RND transporter periplasmic adaptor subunit n=1 Tax=Ignavibacterium sp. TaxID=2651167 RepID=UPI00307E642A
MKSKKIILIASALLIIAAAVYILFFSSGNKTLSENKQLYTCGMHPQIISDEPGNCPICEMKLTPVKQSQQSNKERKILYYRNPMNPSIISDHPQKDEMGMDYVPVYEDEASAEGIVTIDPEVQQNMNIKTEIVQYRKLSSVVTTNGILTIDETRQNIVTTRVDGWIEKLYVNYTGQLIQKGSKLMDIYSPMLISAQQELITALSYNDKTNLAQLKDLKNSGNELIKQAEKKLKLLNITDDEIERIKNTKEIRTTLTLYSKYSGTVLEKNIIEGQKIMAGEPLLKIADLSSLWLTADIYEYELQKVKLGSKVSLKLKSFSDKTFFGKVSFIYPTIDPDSRTIKIRADINNSSGLLKPNMYAAVSTEGPETKVTPAIPENSVIRTGKKDIVIIDLGNGKFKPQEVQLGLYADGYYQVLSGLTEGMKIVTSAQFLIDSESNLKAAINQFQNIKQDKTTDKVNEGMNMQNPKQQQTNDSEKNKTHEHNHSSSIIHEGIIDVESIDKNKDGKLWECPMDWNVISDEARRCPLCNMKLKEYSIEEIKTNLDKYGYKYKN